jgi:hypothetical protein
MDHMVWITWIPPALIIRRALILSAHEDRIVLVDPLKAGGD